MSQLLDQVGGWAALVTVLALAFRLSGSIRVVAVLMLLRVGARLIGDRIGDRPTRNFGRRALVVGLVSRALLIAPLALVDDESELWWAGVLLAGLACAGSVTEGARETLLAGAIPRASLSAAGALASVIERLSLAAGPLLGALALVVGDYSVAFLMAAVLMLGAAVVARFGLLRVAHPADDRLAVSTAYAEQDTAEHGDLRERWSLPVIVAGLLPVVIVAAGLQLLLVEAIDVERGRDESLLGILFGAVGLGTVAGPLPIARMLVRLPMTLVLSGIVLAQAMIVVLLVTTQSLPIVLPALFVAGLLSATSEAATAIQVRRSVSAGRLGRITGQVRLAGVVGQASALVLAIALIGAFDLASIVRVMALCCAFAGFMIFIVGEGQRRLGARGMRAV